MAHMDDDVKRRLISAFSQWKGVVELINEKAKRSHDDWATLAPLILSDPHGAAMEESLRHSDRDDAVRQVMVAQFGAQFTNLVGSRTTRVMVEDPHFLVLALEHVANAVRLLRPGLARAAEACVAAREYERLWDRVLEHPVHDGRSRCVRVCDVRNALEHEEEYLAGKGRRPWLVAPSWNGGPLVGRSRHLTSSSRGIETIEVLGKTYPVWDVIDCCLNRLSRLLQQVMTPLCRTQTQ